MTEHTAEIYRILVPGRAGSLARSLILSVHPRR